MPERALVDAFIDLVRSGRYVEAIENFYAEDAIVHENAETSRQGRGRLVANELAVLASLKEMRTVAVGPVVIEGGRVVIRWVFEAETKDGAVLRLDELALQRWEGDKISEEHFYYDPSYRSRPIAAWCSGGG